ncbi:MAG: ankyrin repeat domain-containing protein [Pyrinomonadaceae bacterium]|nr:ankyrin repeat domain-containing protein [Pyrinomonadaceae bacterium]
MIKQTDMWRLALQHLSGGNFTALQDALGGPGGFDRQIVVWYEGGKFVDEPEMLAEALSCACMLGRTDTAKFLLDKGVDPYAGMKTWLAGPHYAVSGGHLETVKMLLEHKIPLEVKNLHGGTLLGQAFWSILKESKADHAEIIEILLNAGAEIETGTLQWWQDQKLPSEDIKHRVAKALGDASNK